MTEVDVKSPQSSALDQSKPAEPAGHEQDQSHFVPQGPSGQPFPPPNFAFYTYPPSHPPPPPPADSSNPDPNAPPAGSSTGEPMPYPGIYPYVYHQPPPPGYMPVSMSGMPIPSAIIKPKRKQVKMACTNCAAACKRCDVNRPCERCVKYGLSDTCHDGVRKERKKGFKRGPYNKRKRQDDKESSNWDAAATQANPNPEWTPGTSAPPFPPQPPFPPPPEGFYPAFYALGPHPSGPGQLIAVPHNGAHGEHPEGQPDGAVDPNQPPGENGHPPHGQPPFPPHPPFVYPHLPPGAYPFGYPFPGPPMPPPPHHPPPQQQSTQAQQPPQPQQPLPTIPTDELLEDTESRAQQDSQEQPEPSQSQQGQNQEDSQQPSSNSSNGDASNNQSATKKKRASAVAAEEIVKEDEDEDDDSSTPPKKKRGRRPSDADWSATSKRKANGGARARRTAKRQAQTAQEEDHAADLLEADNTQITEVITDQDIVGSSETTGARS